MNKFVKSTVASIVLACSALSASNAMAADSTLESVLNAGELKVCFEAGYMPFEMKAKNGQFIGFDIDVAKHMARSIGVKYVPVNTAWDGIIPALQTNKCDIIMAGMTITPERNLKVNFAQPYIVIGQSIILSSKLEGKIHSYKDLNNPKYTIATKLGTTGAEAAKKYLPKAKLDLYDTEVDSVLQVTNGKADAFVYDFPYNAIYAAQHKDGIVHLSKPFTYEPLGWAIRQNDPNFLNFLNNYLRQIKGDGTYERIYDKWFKSDSWLKNVQ
ncbi:MULTISPECIES: transporter substrate-binding domain-containing protein [Vibrio]|uniref:Transporter substrate-binding domain-containing protein n=2 Tax=Vibrio TaxID=662 RepID=A0A7X4RWY2_9VIBR|nr:MULTISPECIES: transporter substrate-binding domain-containing protein [Vibrio]MBF9002799.1 transporter substrate-binding domain-containing protein [Vibrio nitrifigilis]MZI95842.1 transporter substrate-binding domain-containing protein [Vibrio eleionomae]